MTLRRIQKELTELEKWIADGTITYISNLEYDEDNLFDVIFTLLPQNEPYCKGGFKVYVHFPSDYPFKPLDIKFLTPIYHSNIDDKGYMCSHCSVLSPNNWAPSINLNKVILHIIDLLKAPKIDCGNREMCVEYTNNLAAFNAKAIKHTREYAEWREVF